MRILSIKELPLAGARLVEYARFKDERGYFTEIWRRDDFLELARDVGREAIDFVQVNESRSRAKVVRGLHLQFDPPQGKLIRALHGRTWDLALDARPLSPTFGSMMMVELAPDRDGPVGRWVWLPPGLAHGNLYLEDSSIEYFCDAPYNPAGEAGLTPLDPAIDLGACPAEARKVFKDLLSDNPVLSERDRAGLTLEAWRRDPRSALAV